jgi:hypothetical protein
MCCRALIMASATLASKERSTHPATSEARASQNRAYTVPPVRRCFGLG